MVLVVFGGLGFHATGQKRGSALKCTVGLVHTVSCYGSCFNGLGASA